MSEPTSIDFRRPERSGEGPRACVVIAVLDEAENVAAVCEETLREMERAGAFEIVFVDDGSRDATPDILQDIAAKDPRVRLVRHDPSLRQVAGGPLRRSGRPGPLDRDHGWRRAE